MEMLNNVSWLSVPRHASNMAPLNGIGHISFAQYMLKYQGFNDDYLQWHIVPIRSIKLQKIKG